MNCIAPLALATLLTSSALADTQNWIPSGFVGVEEDASILTSGTTPQDVDVEVGAKGAAVYLSATTTSVTAQLQLRNSDGVVLASETITVGPQVVSRTFEPPFFNYDFKVSPTGGLTGTNTLHVNIQQAK